MPVWCPNCNAMLAEGVEQCPRCGAAIQSHQLDQPAEDETEVEPGDFFWYSAYTIAVVLIPIIVIIGLGLLCFFLFLNNKCIS